MLIFPLAKLIAAMAFQRKTAGGRSELGRVALESTMAMIGGLFAAWLMLGLRPAWVFPLAAVAVGTHYAVFRTVYGDVRFWVLGGLITAVGVAGVLHTAWVPGGTALVVGLTELVFGALLAALPGAGGRSEA